MSGDIKFKYPQVTTLASLDKIISGAIEAAKTMKMRVQSAAIGCMILAGHEGVEETTGQEWAVLAINRANYLVERAGQGIHGQALVKFLTHKCGFKVNPGDPKAGFMDSAKPLWIVENLESAKATAWFSFAPKNAFKGFDLMEELGKVLKRAGDMEKTAEVDKEKAKTIKVNKDMLEAIHSLMSGTPVKTEHALTLISNLIPESMAVAA